MNKLDFGKKAKDKITGFTGTLTGLCSYITGCDQYLITPKAEAENKCPDSKWFDENRLEIIEENEKISIETDQHHGAMDLAPTK